MSQSSGQPWQGQSWSGGGWQSWQGQSWSGAGGQSWSGAGGQSGSGAGGQSSWQGQAGGGRSARGGGRSARGERRRSIPAAAPAERLPEGTHVMKVWLPYMPSDLRSGLSGWTAFVRSALDEGVTVRIRGRDHEPPEQRQRRSIPASGGKSPLMRRLVIVAPAGPEQLHAWHRKVFRGATT